MGRVTGKVALITGGASGLGRASAELLAAEGARVFIADIDDAGAKKVCADITGKAGEATALHLDVTSESDWASAVAQILKEGRGLHILVNNAGISIVRTLLEVSYAEWRRTIAVNLDSVFLGTKACLPALIDSGNGSIVNISSSAGIVGSATLAPYCASKGGVRLFTKAVALECAQARNGVRVNSVHPGGVETPIWGKMSFGGDMPEGGLDPKDVAEKRAWTEAVTPLGRAGVPLEIATGVLFLASDESSYMTGSELVIDGGMSAG